MNAAAESLARVGVIAGNTLREAARQRLALFLALVAGALVVAAQWLRDFNFGAPELKFVADFGFGAIALFGSALTIAATTQLFFSEFEHRTVLTLLAKPVRRGEFLAGKLLGAVAAAAAFAAAMTALLAAVLWLRETALMGAHPEAFAHGRAIDYAAVAGAGAAQAVKFATLAALVLLVASFARTPLFTAASGFLVLAVCHLQGFAQEAAARGGPGVARVFAGLLGVAFPDYAAFDFAGAVGAGEALDWGRLARLAVYGAVYTAAVGGLAAASFRQREI